MRIYTEINWRWTESGLEEEVSSSTQYCGDLSLCGGDSNGGGSSSTDTPTSTPTPTPKPKRQYGYSPGDPRFRLPKPKSPPPVTDTPEPEPEPGFGYTPETGITYRTSKERSDAAHEATRHAVLHGTLEGSGYEDDTFLMRTTQQLSTNDPDYDAPGSGGETTGSADPVPESTTTVTTPAPAPEESTIEEEDPDVEQTIGDELAMRRVRRRLRDRFGRRATRGGGAEMAGTGYRLGG